MLLTEHVHILFTEKAKDWYWRYNRNNHVVTWNHLCADIKGNFGDHLSDADIRETIRERKQSSKKFDDFYHNIFMLTDRLKFPMSEQELVEVLLRPHLRKEIFYLDIPTISHLRNIVLRREALSQELDNVQKCVTTRRINEISTGH